MKPNRPDYSALHPCDPGPMRWWESALFVAGLIAPWVAVALHFGGWLR